MNGWGKHYTDKERKPHLGLWFHTWNKESHRLLSALRSRAMRTPFGHKVSPSPVFHSPHLTWPFFERSHIVRSQPSTSVLAHSGSWEWSCVSLYAVAFRSYFFCVYNMIYSCPLRAGWQVGGSGPNCRLLMCNHNSAIDCNMAIKISEPQ